MDSRDESADRGGKESQTPPEDITMELSDTSKTAIYSGAALLALVPFLYRLGALSSLMVLGLAV